MDVWSLGAIFSTVATWIVLGAQGVAHFKRIRQAATLNSKRGDQFHNGLEVLPEVSAWHDLLRYSLRRSDSLTGKILDLIDQHMLKGDPKLRISVGDLHQLYNKLLTNARKDADLEPCGPLWLQHRDMITLTEREIPIDDSCKIGAVDALLGPNSSSFPPVHPPEHTHDWDPHLGQDQPTAIRFELNNGMDGMRTCDHTDATKSAALQSQPVSPQSRAQSPTGITLNPEYNMAWARRNLRLNEKRVRSPSRSLLMSAAKKMGMRRKGAKSGDELLAQFYKDRDLVSKCHVGRRKCR